MKYLQPHAAVVYGDDALWRIALTYTSTTKGALPQRFFGNDEIGDFRSKELSLMPFDLSDFSPTDAQR